MKNSSLLSIICLVFILSATPALSQESVDYTISWDPITDPAVSEVRVYRSLTGNPTDYAYIGSVPVANTQYADIDLDEGQQYYYCLKSANILGGESGYSASVSGLTLNDANSKLEQDRCRVVNITKLDETSCRVEWSTLNRSVGKVIYWSVESGGVNETPVTTDPDTDHSVVLSNLDPDRVYMLRAASYDDYGNLTRSMIDYYSSNGQVTDVAFVASTSEVTVPEGGTAEFGVRLSAQPLGSVQVLVMRMGGDTDIQIESGGSLEFAPGNWNDYQTVTLRAQDDADGIDGETMIMVATTGGDIIVPTAYVTAREDDDDATAVSAAAAPEIAIYPVPFAPNAGDLNFDNLPQDGKLSVYDLKGREVWKRSWSGQTSLGWDGRNSKSVQIAAGRYFVVIRDDSGSVVEKRAVLVIW